MPPQFVADDHVQDRANQTTPTVAARPTASVAIVGQVPATLAHGAVAHLLPDERFFAGWLHDGRVHGAR